MISAKISLKPILSFFITNLVPCVLINTTINAGFSTRCYGLLNSVNMVGLVVAELSMDWIAFCSYVAQSFKLDPGS